jgi:hypothetical protein
VIGIIYTSVFIRTDEGFPERVGKAMNASQKILWIRGLAALAAPLALTASAVGQTTQPTSNTPVVTQTFQGHTYELFVNNSASFTQAQSLASGAGGYLTAITSSGEDQFISQLLSNGQAPTGSYWIGLMNNTVSTGPLLTGWTWTDNEPFSYANWTPGVPDNHLGKENRGSILWTSDSSAATFSRRGQWNDLPDSGYPNADESFAGTDLARGGYIVEINSLTGNGNGGTGGAAVPVPAAALMFIPGAGLALISGRRLRRPR